LDFEKTLEKRKKRRSNNIYNYSPEYHGDHPQSVLLADRRPTNDGRAYAIVLRMSVDVVVVVCDVMYCG